MGALYKKFQASIETQLGKIALPKIAVAVSSGSDSMALLLLMSQWAKIVKCKLVVLTVDHDLRPEAKAECEYVCQFSMQLGHECFVLKWDHHNQFSNLQARARDARYSLMTELCKKQDIIAIATAHHLDDSIENYYIRKSRKSGLFGLSSSDIGFNNNIMIIRPLVTIYKQELVEFLYKNGVKWFEDQSNYSDKYLRNRIRKSLSILERKELEIELAAIDLQVKQFGPLFIKAIASVVAINKLGAAKINIDNLENYHNDIRFQLISFILTIISGKLKTPRYGSVELIIELLNCSKNFVKTLHGCILQRTKDELLIYRECGRTLSEEVKLAKNVIWDNRFRYDGEEVKDSYINNLTMDDYVKIKDKLDLSNIKKHQEILFTLPVVKTLEKILAIPHISYYDDKGMIGKLGFSFQPQFTSRFTHFF